MRIQRHWKLSRDEDFDTAFVTKMVENEGCDRFSDIRFTLTIRKTGICGFIKEIDMSLYDVVTLHGILEEMMEKDLQTEANNA